MMSRYEKKEGTDTVFLQENRYDGSGKRIEKKEIRERENEAQPGDTSLEKVTKRYTYQGDTVLQTDVSHIDVSGFNGTPETGQASDDTESFNLLTPGGNIVSTSRKHEDNSGEAENWYTFNKDYNGSTTSIISHTGAAVSTYEYDDYGTISAVTDDIDNEVCYTGQIYDEGTGLYYYNARYYDSEGACFTSMDTYRGDNMLPLTLNLYMYCGGDPINYTDPTGHGFLKKLYKKLVKAATKSSSRKASRKTTKKSTHRASATVRRKAVVKRVSSAAKKVKKKVKKAAKKAVKTIKKTSSRKFDKAIKKISGVSKKEHFSRNKKNKDLPSYEEIKENKESGWEKAKQDDAVCHQFNTKNGKPNIKYVNSDGREVVYFSDGTINNTAEDQGTYDLCPNSDSIKGHFVKDVVPWIAWGNSPDDRTSVPMRLIVAGIGLKLKKHKIIDNLLT